MISKVDILTQLIAEGRAAMAADDVHKAGVIAAKSNKLMPEAWEKFKTEDPESAEAIQWMMIQAIESQLIKN